MALPSWWQVTTPHKDIREGRLSEAIFAADLGDVVYGKASLEYKDASTFFQKTYLTQGVKNLLENVLSRLSGGKGDPVIQLQTPFGGAKTHALLALYHVIKHRKGIEHITAVSELLNSGFGQSSAPSRNPKPDPEGSSLCRYTRRCALRKDSMGRDSRAIGAI